MRFSASAAVTGVLGGMARAGATRLSFLWRRLKVDKNAPALRKCHQGLRKLSPDLISQAQDETAKQVTRLSLTLLGTAAFCLLSLLSPDSTLLGGGDKINVPFAGPVSFLGFMLLGPAVLIALRFYLQIYVEHGNRLDRVARSMSILRAPTLLPLQNPLIRFFSGLIFYTLLPAATIFFAWKAAVFPYWGFGLFGLAAAIIASHVLLPFPRLSWRSKVILSVAAAIICGGTMLRIGPPHRQFQLYRANLSGQFLAHESLSKTNLSYVNLSGAQLLSVDLRGADLSGANLSTAVLQTVDLTGADLSRSNLSTANLTAARMNGANLVSANLTGARLLVVFLTDAFLVGANLSGAFLSQTDLSRANLAGATLSGANLRDNTKLEGTNLSNATLSGANMREVTLNGADLTAADLGGADLTAAELGGANLYAANLVGAHLSDADLSGAELSRANLSGADLSNASLSGAKLIDTKLGGARLSGADLTGAQFLAQGQLDDACGDTTTKLPADFTIKPCTIVK
jgi:uncharacterized protein YjbI with pentapeptide repeats